MTQPHHETETGATAPIWYGPGSSQPAAPHPHAPSAPQYPGAANHPSGTPPQSPEGPGSPGGPGSPAGPPPAAAGHQAQPAPPARRRRWAELTAVATLAAVLSSGGTYAVTQLEPQPSQPSSASASSLGRGTDTAPVAQADPNNPNWTVTASAVSPSVVAISVQARGGSGQGSGVIIDDRGHVLTNNHVVSGGGSGAEITVTLADGRTFEASIAGTDPSTDLAVLTIASPPDDLEPVALGNSDDLEVGDPVMAVGNPLGLAGTVTTGIVSALNRPVTTEGEGGGVGGQAEPVVTNAIQTSAAINPGNSGGALVNASGQLVGINSSIATLGQGGSSGNIGIGFAIPVNEAKHIATQLIEKGSAEHAYLGVSSEDGTASDGEATRAGATVTRVWPGTPAAAAGLQEGDTIVAVNDERVDSTLSLVAHVRERPVGENITLTVLRDGKEQKLEATLTAKTSAP